MYSDRMSHSMLALSYMAPGMVFRDLYVGIHQNPLSW